MAFQLKDFVSIVAGMLNHLRGTSVEITDFNVGSVARSLIEAPAIEMDELYQQMFIGLREAIPVAVFKSFDFEKLPARFASGLVSFIADPVFSTGISIPAGTSVRVPGSATSYVTQSLALLLPNTSSVQVMVVSDLIGAAGNVAASTVTELVGNIHGITSVSNLASFSGGRDIELDNDRKIRFQAYISTIAKGTTAAIEYGAKTAIIANGAGLVTEAVAYASVIEPYLLDPTQPPSVTSCTIHNGAGGTSAELVDRAQLIIDGYRLDNGSIVTGWKAAGVICTVVAATEIEIKISGVLTIAPNFIGDTVRTAVLIAANDYVQSLPIGTEVILSEVIAVIMAVDGVYKINLTSPLADTVLGREDKSMPSGLSAISWVPLE